MIDIYEYDDILEYFNALLEDKKSRNPNFSLRSWSKNLGYKFPSYLSQCLRGERAINFSLMLKVFDKEGLNEAEREYLLFLFLKHQVRGVKGICLDGMTQIVRNAMRSESE